MSKLKNYSQQWITQDDIISVKNTMQSSYLTGGPKVTQFEKLICDYTASSYSVAYNSATSALHAACLALGADENSVVWTSSISFIASANCARMCSSTVDFVDINEKDFLLSPSKLEKKLKYASVHNKLPDILIVVHLAGLSVNMVAISKLAKEYKFRVIEDASHALSSTYKGTKVGSCKYSDITIFSFHPVKIITTLEGGVATTNDEHLHKVLRMTGSHYMTTDVYNENLEPWEYHQVGLGFNYRMNEVQAALGISQMKRIEEAHSMRVHAVKEYAKLLNMDKVSVQFNDCKENSAHHLYIIQILGSGATEKRRELYYRLLELGYKTNVHYIPIHTQPYYRALGQYSDLNNSTNYYKRALSLPLFPTIEKANLIEIANAVNRI